MKLHANAALSLNGRRRLCERVLVAGWMLTTAAKAAEVSVRTARKWVRRYRAEGEAGLVQGGAGHRVTGHKHTHIGSDRKRHVGWEYVHVCIDDATRLAYVGVLADEKATTAIGSYAARWASTPPTASASSA